MYEGEPLLIGYCIGNHDEALQQAFQLASKGCSIIYSDEFSSGLPSLQWLSKCDCYPDAELIIYDMALMPPNSIVPVNAALHSNGFRCVRSLRDGHKNHSAVDRFTAQATALFASHRANLYIDALNRFSHQFPDATSETLAQAMNEADIPPPPAICWTAADIDRVRSQIMTEPEPQLDDHSTWIDVVIHLRPRVRWDIVYSRVRLRPGKIPPTQKAFLATVRRFVESGKIPKSVLRPTKQPTYSQLVQYVRNARNREPEVSFSALATRMREAYFDPPSGSSWTERHIKKMLSLSETTP